MKQNSSYIGKDTSFEGVIYTNQKITVEGTVEGDIKATDKVIVKQGALIAGAIQTKKVFFEEGSRHEGRMKMWKATSFSYPQPPESAPSGVNEEEPTEEVAEQKAPGQPKGSTSRPLSSDTKKLW